MFKELINMYNKLFKRKQKHKITKQVIFYFKNEDNNMSPYPLKMEKTRKILIQLILKN